jgi:hypothetical protein
MHMRIGLVVVQDHDIAVIRELGLRELARRPLNDERVRSSWHRQDDS